VGIHRRFEGSGGGGGGGEPIPLPPKAGRGQESCDGTSCIDLEFELTPQIDEDDADILDFFIIGATIKMYTFDDWSGDAFPNGDGPDSAQESSGEIPTDVGYDEEPNPPEKTGTTKDEDGPGQVNDPYPHTSSEPNELEKREEYEIKKINKKVDGQKVKIKVHGQNEKEILLERKINKKLGDGTTPTVKDAVESIITDCGFTEYYIDDVTLPMPEFDVGEYFARDVLDICALISGAAYTVLDGAFHFFQTNSRPSRTAVSTDYKTFALEEEAPIQGKKVNPVRKGTANTTEDATNLTNRVQQANSGKKSENPKKDVWPSLGSDEYHTTYEPMPPFTTYLSTGGEAPVITYPAFVRQDWGDSPEVEHYKSLGVPYPSPDYDGVVDPVSVFGVYVNIKEKAFRLVYAATGQPYYPLLSGGTFEAMYYHKDPVFRIIQDDESILEYGIRETIIVSPSRQYDAVFKAIGEAMVKYYSKPLFNVECEVYNDVFRVGDYVRFHFPQLNFDEWKCVYEISRDFDAGKRGKYPSKDFGQSVRIKAGDKAPQTLRNVLAWMNNKIKELDRKYNQSDLDSESGFSVPVDWDRIFQDEIDLREVVSMTRTVVGKIDAARIDEGIIP